MAPDRKLAVGMKEMIHGAADCDAVYNRIKRHKQQKMAEASTAAWHKRSHGKTTMIGTVRATGGSRHSRAETVGIKKMAGG